MGGIIQLEDTTENLVIDCFKTIEAVYKKGKKCLNDAKKSKNHAVVFALKKTFTKENDIRDYIFKGLKDSGYNNFDKEKDKKDLTCNFISSHGFTFIIEAKRLDGSAHLNSEYIKNGVNRFKNKDSATDYSNDIKRNQNIGGMLGFIIDKGEISNIVTTMKDKVIENDNKDEILIGQFILDKEKSFITKNGYFKLNKRNGGNFTLYHQFLDYSNI